MLNKLFISAGAAAFALALSGAAAQASTVVFDTWTDTDSPSTDPLIVISETGDPNIFTVDVSLDPLSLDGSIITLYFDIGDDYASMDVTDCCYNPVDAASTSGVIDPSAVKPFGQIGSNVYTEFDFALEFDKKDEVGDVPVSFTLEDINDVLVLSDFYAVGVRVQEVGPNGDSDKLLGYASVSAPVPLPAGGVLLLSALAGGAVLRRKRKAS